MTTPIIELISENIKTAVNEITVATSFNQTLTGYRPKRNDFKDVVPADLLVLIIQGDEEEVEETVSNGVSKEWRQPYLLMALVIDSDAATTTYETRINQVKADLIKKLMTDPSRGGYALDTIPRPGIKIPENDYNWSGIVANFDVYYRTKINDPYTQI